LTGREKNNIFRKRQLELWGQGEISEKESQKSSKEFPTSEK
jgi:hypothetical protein